MKPWLDEQGRDGRSLAQKKLFLFDMDGTLYRGGQLFGGTLPLLRQIEAMGARSMYITNNSSKSVEDYVAKLAGMGVPARKEDFFTSAQATARLLRRNYPGQTVFCMGTGSLVQELRQSGIPVVTRAEPGVGVVLLGYDTELTYQKLWDACVLLQGPVAYLATNPDWVCPTEWGFVPDCGSFSEMLRRATGRWPTFVGKPEPTMVLCVCEALGVAPADAVVVGDRLYTDIRAGVRANATTICVLSGETTRADLEKGETKPDYVFRDVQAICDCLRAGREEL